MKKLRNNTFLAAMLALAFIVQLFVPLAVNAKISNDEPTGFVICTASGLKQLTAEGELVAINTHEQQSHDQGDCYVCMTGGCSTFFAAQENFEISVSLRSDNQILLPLRSQQSWFLIKRTGTSVRAPPSI